jgi:hypothetical protein
MAGFLDKVKGYWKEELDGAKGLLPVVGGVLGATARTAATAIRTGFENTATLGDEMLAPVSRLLVGEPPKGSSSGSLVDNSLALMRGNGAAPSPAGAGTTLLPTGPNGTQAPAAPVVGGLGGSSTTSTSSATTFAPPAPGMTPIPTPTVTALPAAEDKKVPFTFDPKGTIPQDQFEQAYASPASLPGFVGRALEGTTQLQQGVLNAWDTQNTNQVDLAASRGAEGMDAAQARLSDVNRRVNDFNARVSMIENDVRKDLGGEVTESAIQAEVNNRMKQMQPEAARLDAEQKTATSDYQFTVDRVNQTMNARRSDAADAVNRANTALGFSKDNIDMAMNLMVQTKNIELANDYQKNQERDDARAIANILVANPAAMRNVDPQEMANLEARAQMVPGTLSSLKDAWRTATPVIMQPDGNDLSYALWDASTGTLSFGKQKDFFTVNQTAVSASSASNAKLSSNMSDTFQSAVKSVTSSIATEFSKLKTTDDKKAFMVQASAYLQNQAAETKNPADQAIADSFSRSVFSASSFESTLDQFNANVAAVGSAQ